MENNRAPETKYIRPLSIEAVIALVVALINLALDQADIHIMLVSWVSTFSCIGLCIDALRRTEWIGAKGTKSSRFILTGIAITSVFLVFGWFLSRPRKPVEAARQDPIGALVRLNKVNFGPPVEGKQQVVDIGYSNIGPSTISLKLTGSVAIVDSGKMMSFDGGISETVDADIGPDLENKVWKSFLTRYKQDLEGVSGFFVLPPYVDSWSSIQGPIVSMEEVANINANRQKVLIFLLARFTWKVEGSDSVYGYDICQFITGSTNVVFNCSAHNGPIKLR